MYNLQSTVDKKCTVLRFLFFLPYSSINKQCIFTQRSNIKGTEYIQNLAFSLWKMISKYRMYIIKCVRMRVYYVKIQNPLSYILPEEGRGHFLFWPGSCNFSFPRGEKRGGDGQQCYSAAGRKFFLLSLIPSSAAFSSLRFFLPSLHVVS